MKKWFLVVKKMDGDEGVTQLENLNLARDEKFMESVSIEDESEKFLLSESSYSRKRTYNRWSPMEEGVTLAWRDLSIYIHTKEKGSRYKRIINSVTGAVKRGSLVALMGASGSGKTTLMSALAHRPSKETVVEGDILINGRPIGHYMRHISGFMHQEDLFTGSLTVWEHMNIMAHLKLDRRTPKITIRQKIRDTLNQLGLLRCSKTRIGVDGEDKTLSGGERKRLAFATELLTDPPLLFCDEPTTGLDSYSAQKIVTMMNMMASSGKTIVCTIHQPSSEVFTMFSQLILLADGRVAYMGSMANAIEFFERLGYICPHAYNPADFFIKILALTPGAEEASIFAIKRICNHFAVSDYIKEIDVVVQYEFHMGRANEGKRNTLNRYYKEPFCWTKLYWLLYRNFLVISRNSSSHLTRIFEKMCLALAIGLCYLTTESNTQNGIQSIQGMLFMFVTENTFNPMYSVLPVFPLNRPLFNREYKSGLYSTALYYVSKIIALMPSLLVEATAFVTIAYWMAGLKATMDAFLLTTLVTILTINTSTACGIFFSTAFESAPNALAYLVPFDYVLMITSGLFIKLSSLPEYISWTKYLSWLMYSTETLSIIQWRGVQNITCDTAEADLPCLSEGSEVLEKYSFDGENLNRDLWSMLLLCVAFHVLGFLCLWRNTRRR